MFESPKSLQELCIDFICRNLLALSEIHFRNAEENSSSSCEATPSDQQNNSPTSNKNPDPGLGATRDKISSAKSSSLIDKLSFRHPDAFLPAEVSDQLLAHLSEKNILTDLAITLFDSKSTRLRHVRLKDASALTERGLRILKQHKVIDLVVNGLRSATVNDLISCLGDWSIENLRSLSVVRGSFMNCSRYCVIVTLNQLKSLHTLNVSGTDFNKHGLDIVVEDLHLLQNLNISCTRVDDITPLKKCKDRLKVLSMYNLRLNARVDITSVLLELNHLRSLDISDEKDTHAFDMFAPARQKINKFLRAVHCMPYLVSLDLSGKDEIKPRDLRAFIKAHPHLRFLGLVHSDACYDDSLINPANPDYRPELVVSGTATESQILEALKRYTCRPIYVQKCLFQLFRLTSNFREPRVDVIKLVLPGMREHPREFRVQIAATACIYNLIKGELATMIHPSILKQIVELTLIAMESYPQHYQLQKNTLLTLCSDRILQDITFDKYRCARLVMNCLSTFDDPNMNRMSVAICSILAAKISTVQTSMLGGQPRYMSKLLAMVRSKVQSKSVDITMKFTLSALWNLTDESEKTCEVFLNEGGMELFLEVLENFQGQSSVETKVLGLLNNIAEVAHLRPRLMKQRFISMLSMLLDSVYLDVSYFAAGIAAHLLSDGPSAWYLVPTEPSRDQLLEQLTHAVTHWDTPQGEMVAYRSFQPFFPLLLSNTYPVQLWAVWAIHHVCTKNPERYCMMLVKEVGLKTLRDLESMHTEHAAEPNIRSLCRSILEILHKILAEYFLPT